MASRPKIKAQHGIYTGQPSGTTFAAKPHDMTAKNSSEGRKIRDDFGVTTQEPNGTTFESHKRAGVYGNWNGEQVRAPAGQSKKPERFGVEMPTGVTSNNGSAGTLIDTPDASAAPLRGIKTITESTGIFRPAKSGPKNMIGDVPVGKSSMKRGATDKGDSSGFAKD
jgi:hypothetical protein